MMIVYHGTAAWNVPGLLSGQSAQLSRLYVTESAELAQRYADAQASREVSAEVRRVAGSAVLTLETDEAVRWLRRPADHGTLDVAEAAISAWRVVAVTVYTTSYDLDRSRMTVGGRSVPTYAWLREQLGDRLTIEVIV